MMTETAMVQRWGKMGPQASKARGTRKNMEVWEMDTDLGRAWRIGEMGSKRAHTSE